MMNMFVFNLHKFIIVLNSNLISSSRLARLLRYVSIFDSPTQKVLIRFTPMCARPSVGRVVAINRVNQYILFRERETSTTFSESSNTFSIFILCI